MVTQLAQAEPEGGAVEITRWDPQDREVQVRVDKPSIVRLKTYNFPGWTARIDGKAVPMLSDKDGVQQVEAPPGIHRIQASFRNTPPSSRPEPMPIETRTRSGYVQRQRTSPIPLRRDALFD